MDQELIDLMKKKGAWQAANFTREASVFAFVKTPPFIDDLPGLQDVDFSAAKLTHIKERVHVQFRAEVFNLMNHPNFGQPNRTTTSADFGRIIATRTARGDLGSSRQLQLGLKLTF